MHYGEHLKLVNYETRRIYDLGKIIARGNGPTVTQLCGDRKPCPPKEMLQRLVCVLTANYSAPVKLFAGNVHQELEDLMDDGFVTVFLDEALT